MDAAVFLAVLLAAVLHAGWNSILKLGLDRLSAMLMLALVQAGIALPLLPFVARPDAAAWGWIAAAALLHTGYKLFLVQAYAHADLSQAYPLARGTAPLIVTVVSAAVLGEPLSLGGLLAILAISAGILAMAAGGPGRMGGRAVGFAVATAGFTAAYTLVDAVGARAAGTAAGFILWMVVGDALAMTLYARLVRGRSAFAGFRTVWASGLAAGAMSLGAYWIAVWAFTQAPVALVAALRETSILFALIIAAVVLREPVGGRRWLSAAAIAAGVAAMRM